METANIKTFVNELQFSVSPRNIKENEQYKLQTKEKIMAHFCAVFNSGGGKLTLRFSEKCSHKDLDNFVRMVEQWLQNLTSATTVSDITVEKSLEEVVMITKASDHLITVNYNIYLPDESEVISLPSSEPMKNVRSILQRKTNHINRTSVGSHRKHFVLEEQVEFAESKNNQRKLIKADPSKQVTVAKRICGKSNKLACYISAFANHSGGHVYYGIDEDGIVEGERLTKKDKDKIVKEVIKLVSKMMWPDHVNRPKRGEHWDIFFEPVKDIEDGVVESVFVVVVFVAQCLGGVFTARPDSYKVVNGKVEKIKFREWLSHFKNSSRSVGTQVSITQPNTRETRASVEFMERLKLHRNNNNKCETKLADLANEEQARNPEYDAHLMALSEKVITSYKKHHFRKAQKLLAQFTNSCMTTLAKNRMFFKIRGIYLQSCIESAKGNYESSYKIAVDGLDEIKLPSTEPSSRDYWMHLAMLATILSCRCEQNTQCKLLRMKALDYLKSAMKVGGPETPEIPPDLQQKLHIYKACVLLGCSLTGEAVDAKHVTDKDITAATIELLAVAKTIEGGKPLSHYRKIQNMFAECDLFFRFPPNLQNLKHALELAREARALAAKLHFREMELYARKREAAIVVKLLLYSYRKQSSRG